MGNFLNIQPNSLRQSPQAICIRLQLKVDISLNYYYKLTKMNLNFAILWLKYLNFCLSILYRTASNFSRQTARAKTNPKLFYVNDFQVVCFLYIYLSSLVLHIKILFTTKTLKRNLRNAIRTLYISKTNTTMLIYIELDRNICCFV